MILKYIGLMENKKDRKNYIYPSNIFKSVK